MASIGFFELWGIYPAPFPERDKLRAKLARGAVNERQRKETRSSLNADGQVPPIQSEEARTAKEGHEG